MKLTQNFITMVLLVSFFLMFFYSTLHMDKTFGLKPGSDNLQWHLSQKVNIDYATQNPELENLYTARPQISIASISDNLRKTISENGAYWNRVFHLAVSKLKTGEHFLNQDYDWSNCREINPEALQTNVNDFNNYPILFQGFLQGMKCRSPPVLINQPNKCISGEGKAENQTILLFAIKSCPGNFEQRMAVRETWGREGIYKNGLRVYTVFLLGSSSQDDPDLSPMLSFEARRYRDLLQWDFEESFLNLTLKLNAFLQWTLNYCPHVSFVFSGDDDVFVNSPALINYLQNLEPTKATQLYVGQVINTASPLRDPRSKYYIPLSFYESPYPPYAGGGGFLFPGALLEPLYSVSQVIPLFPIDDVYAGMCFSALGVSPEKHEGFKTFDVREQDRENLCTYKDLILIHKRSPKQIKKLWRGIHSPLLTC